MLLNKLHFDRDITSELLKIALPMVISQGTFAVMIFTDRYFMSQIDPIHMAAALGGGVACFFSFCFFSGLLSYSNALAAQYLGSGEQHKCAKVVSQGFLIVLLSIPLLALITYGVSKLFAAMDHDPTLVELELIYYKILMLGVVVTLAKICVSSYFAGIARTKVVMICDVCGLVLNVPLCYGMVFGRFGLPELGIVGAAVSTIIATLFAFVLFMGFYLAKEHREKFHVLESFHFDLGIFKRFLRLGTPSGVEIFLNVAAFNLFLLMFQGYGIAEAASASIVFNWDILSFVPMMGINIGIISLIGRYVGARDMQHTNAVMTAGFMMALSYSAVLAVLFISFRFPLVEVFAPPEGDFSNIRAMAGFMMIGLSCYAMADALILVCGGVLRGAGDTAWLMKVSTVLHWAMLVAQYFVIRVFEYGPEVSWVVFCLMIVAIAAVLLFRLQQGHWRDMAALERVMAE
jgi:multidrug resistance protein, MATE family